jgi:hypothetical protein
MKPKTKRKNFINPLKSLFLCNLQNLIIIPKYKYYAAGITSFNVILRKWIGKIINILGTNIFQNSRKIKFWREKKILF